MYFMYRNNTFLSFDILEYGHCATLGATLSSLKLKLQKLCPSFFFGPQKKLFVKNVPRVHFHILKVYGDQHQAFEKKKA